MFQRQIFFPLLLIRNFDMNTSKLLKTLLSVGAAGTLSYAVTVFKVNDKQEPVLADNTRVTWDYNWDKREPVSLINPKKLQKLAECDDKVGIADLISQYTPTATRHIFFIRHGQYNQKFKEDELRTLTQLGQEQAVYTGMRLRDLGITFDKIVESSMTRAIETSSLIQDQLSKTTVVRTDLLREGSPIEPVPPFRDWRSQISVYTDHPRIESAFRKFVHRADYTQEKDSYEVVVCHANVIRYIVCRSMQVAPEAWLRMSLHHGSITLISIHPDGFVTVKSIGEAGHIPKDKLTTS
uniref:Serine/threonine-protein phosphatase PGAM5, mitochondrial n=1 Tax=Phallusia mammillata TaxID=59560 RepID=A0A6F9DMX4_9ASCI|nr:serine/threonine-protein phosphatase PGAM5, mitochondrial-like [Phallusia mammillata]